MKATLMPLIGKYYGTKIELRFDNGDREHIKLWNSGDYEPSIREIKSWGYTQEQWDNNEIIESGYDGTGPIRSLGLICDSHFESKLTYERAMKIVNAINEQK